MAAQRSKKSKVPHLYNKVNKKSGKTYWTYLDIRTNKFHGLGTNKAQAEKVAQQLNALISQQIIETETQAILNNTASASEKITLGAMVDKYLAVLEARVKDGDLKQTSQNNARYKLSKVKKEYGKTQLARFDTLTINKFLDGFVKDGKKAMAKQVRGVLIDLFAEAIAAGHFPADKPNPVAVTKAAKAKVKRARLTLGLFQQALAWAKEHQAPNLWRSYLLALVTGQRRGDIARLTFHDIKTEDGVQYLAVEQGKTGTKLMIPLDLHMDELGLSVRDVVGMCRDNVVSRYLFHHTRNMGKAKVGGNVRPNSMSDGFKDAVAVIKSDWGQNTPPSFHELRSLAERTYKKQGINTQLLLGHKHQITTDKYNDSRGHEWIKVPLTGTEK